MGNHEGSQWIGIRRDRKDLWFTWMIEGSWVVYRLDIVRKLEQLCSWVSQEMSATGEKKMAGIVIGNVYIIHFSQNRVWSIFLLWVVQWTCLCSSLAF